MSNEKKTQAYLRDAERYIGYGLEEVVYFFSQHYPRLLQEVFFPVDQFRGFSIVQAKSGGFLVISKALDAKGLPIINFAHTEVPLLGFQVAQDSIHNRGWRDDTPRQGG